MEIDFNCDLGEGCPFDRDLMPLITSANVSCGRHAGDAGTIRATLQLAANHGVQVGAHPGYDDRAFFGRRELALTSDEILKTCREQIETLAQMARTAGVTLTYVKPHGALYNQACRNADYARPIVQAASLFDLALMGLPHSLLEQMCRGIIPFVAEGFADRRYRPDGTLVPRSQPGAFVTDPQEAVSQARRLLDAGQIRTLCVHGDNPQAVGFVTALRKEFESLGIAIKPFSVP